MNLTDEQKAVSLAPLSGMTKVVAYAGTGKTSSLCALAQRNRGLRGLYLAFNKSAEMDARQRFPRSVQCKTVNALAFGVTGRVFAHKLGSLRPIDAIKFAMEQQGLTVKDLEPAIGRANRVYEVLRRKRALTVNMIWMLHEQLRLPAEALIKPIRKVA